MSTSLIYEQIWNEQLHCWKADKVSKSLDSGLFTYPKHGLKMTHIYTHNLTFSNTVCKAE